MSAPPSVLVVDDEKGILLVVRLLLERHGFRVLTAEGGEEALRILGSEDPHVLVADQRMPSMTGVELLRKAAEVRSETVRIVLTGYTDLKDLIEAINSAGIFRYITKPWEDEDFVLQVRRAAEQGALLRENRRLLKALEEANARLREENQLLEREVPRPAFTEVVSRSPAMRRTLEALARVAATDSTVLLVGETGTGKEVLARTLHASSPRARERFVPANLGAIPESLRESELFGHRKGAFTGATDDRKGLFALAHTGTLFLDEVADAAPSLQVALLRALQERVVQPVGGSDPVRVDVRVVAATNRRLEDEVSRGSFRKDLYFRLSVFPIEVPPLRDRREDILPLAEGFLQESASKVRKGGASTLTPEAQKRILEYPWPGNVRELRNTMERACILSRDGSVSAADLTFPSFTAGGGAATPAGGGDGAMTLHLPSSGRPFDELEREIYEKTLKLAGGNKAQAAKMLGIKEPTFRFRLKKLSLA